MSFYKKHAPIGAGTPRPSGLEPVRRDEGSNRGGRHPDGVRGEGEEANQGTGLEPADSIEDKSEISCFQRGSSPHWSGINTFLRAHYSRTSRR